MCYYERKTVFHGTSKENLEKILKDQEIKTSHGIYGQGVYTILSPHKALRYGDSVIIINPKSIEKVSLRPIKENNRIKDWLIITTNIRLEHILGYFVINEKNKEILFNNLRQGYQKQVMYQSEENLKKIIGSFVSSLGEQVYNPIKYSRVPLRKV